MTRPIIEVRNLGKRYQLGSLGATRLRDEASLLWERLRGRNHPAQNEEFWALQEVSFEVHPGEVVGIIGRNGAGKSTLLKILSRITQQTTGEIVLRGRIASLLEVGTGFHPDLTGKENIFLNGAILGMKTEEIRRKLDAIIAFSEVEQFINTPVKRYSSGMYVRLAFAVAAHLEPEILIVDEVLAVGDTQFQLKCLERIRSISESGRTVLFVSHNLSTVRNLCHSAFLLDKGRLVRRGGAAEVIGHYLSAGAIQSGGWERRAQGREANREGVYFERITLGSQAEGVGGAGSQFESAQTIHIRMETVATKRFENVQIGIRVTNQEGIRVFTTCNTDGEKRYLAIPKGRNVFSVQIPGLLLPAGRYLLAFVAHVPHDRVMDLLDDEISFTVHDTGSHATALKDNRSGVVTPLFQWDMESQAP